MHDTATKGYSTFLKIDVHCTYINMVDVSVHNYIIASTLHTHTVQCRRTIVGPN